MAMTTRNPECALESEINRLSIKAKEYCMYYFSLAWLIAISVGTGSLLLIKYLG